jgi:hypothetical protein
MPVPRSLFATARIEFSLRYCLGASPFASINGIVATGAGQGDALMFPVRSRFSMYPFRGIALVGSSHEQLSLLNMDTPHPLQDASGALSTKVVIVNTFPAKNFQKRAMVGRDLPPEYFLRSRVDVRVLEVAARLSSTRWIRRSRMTCAKG